MLKFYPVAPGAIFKRMRKEIVSEHFLGFCHLDSVAYTVVSHLAEESQTRGEQFPFAKILTERYHPFKSLATRTFLQNLNIRDSFWIVLPGEQLKVELNDHYDNSVYCQVWSEILPPQLQRKWNFIIAQAYPSSYHSISST